MADPPDEPEKPTVQTYKKGLKKWYKVIAKHPENTGLNILPIINAAICSGTDFQKVKFRTTDADLRWLLLHEARVQSRYEKLPDGKYDSDDSEESESEEEDEEMVEEVNGASATNESDETKNWVKWQDLRQQRRAPLQMHLELLGLSTLTTFAKCRPGQSPLKIDMEVLRDDKYRYVLKTLSIQLSFSNYLIKAEKDTPIPKMMKIFMQFMNWPDNFALITKLAGSYHQASRNRDTFMCALGVFVLNGIDVYPKHKDIADYVRIFKITTDENKDMTVTFELGKPHEKDEKHYLRGRRSTMFEYPVLDVDRLKAACIYMLSEDELTFCDENYSQLAKNNNHVFSWLYGPHFCDAQFYKSMAKKIGLGDQYLEFEDLRRQVKNHLSEMQKLERDNFVEDLDDEEFELVMSPKTLEKMKRDGYNPQLEEPNVSCIAAMLEDNSECQQSTQLVESEAKFFLTGKKRPAAQIETEIETDIHENVQYDAIWNEVLKILQEVEAFKQTELQDSIKNLQNHLDDPNIDKTSIVHTKQKLKREQQKLKDQTKRSEKLDEEVEFLNRQAQGCSWLLTNILQIIFSTILLFVAEKHYDDESQSSEKHWTQHLLLLWADQYRIRAIAHLMKQMCKNIEIDDDCEKHTLISMDQLIDAFSDSQLNDSTHEIAVPQRQGHETGDGMKSREDYVFKYVTEKELKHEDVTKLVSDLSFDLASKDQEKLQVRIKEELYGVYAKIHFNQNGGNGPLFGKNKQDEDIYASRNKINCHKACLLCRAIFDKPHMVLPEDFQEYIKDKVEDREQFQLDHKTLSYEGIAALVMLCDVRNLGKVVMKQTDLRHFMNEPDNEDEIDLPEGEVSWEILRDVLKSFISMIDLQSAFIENMLQDVTVIMQKGFDWCQMHKEVTENARNMSDLELSYHDLQTMLSVGPTDKEVHSDGTQTLTLYNSHFVFKGWSDNGFQDLQANDCILKALTDMRDDASEESKSDYSDIQSEAGSDGDSVDAELESDAAA